MKIYNSKRLLFLGIAISSFISCKCKDTVCPALDSKYNTWLNVSNSDSIKFKNNNGATIIFNVVSKITTEGKIKDCKGSSLGCNCSVCEYPFGGYYELTRDSSRKQIDSLGNIYRVHNYNGVSIKYSFDSGNKYDPSLNSNDPYNLSYTIFDQENIIQIHPNLILNTGDSLLSNYNIGGNNYNNVIVHKTDTTKTPQAYLFVPRLKYKFYVTKSYFNKEKGIIAFFDNLTNSLFYRVY